MHRNISRFITEVCKKEGIDYKSPHLLYADAARLGEICLELGSLQDEIDCICSRHNINGNNKTLHDDREAIKKIEHDILAIAEKIKREKK